MSRHIKRPWVEPHSYNLRFLSLDEQVGTDHMVEGSTDDLISTGLSLAGSALHRRPAALMAASVPYSGKNKNFSANDVSQIRQPDYPFSIDHPPPEEVIDAHFSKLLQNRAFLGQARRGLQSLSHKRKWELVCKERTMNDEKDKNINEHHFANHQLLNSTVAKLKERKKISQALYQLEKLLRQLELCQQFLIDDGIHTFTEIIPQIDDNTAYVFLRCIKTLLNHEQGRITIMDNVNMVRYLCSTTSNTGAPLRVRLLSTELLLLLTYINDHDGRDKVVAQLEPYYSQWFSSIETAISSPESMLTQDTSVILPKPQQQLTDYCLSTLFLINSIIQVTTSYREKEVLIKKFKECGIHRIFYKTKDFGSGLLDDEIRKYKEVEEEVITRSSPELPTFLDISYGSILKTLILETRSTPLEHPLYQLLEGVLQISVTRTSSESIKLFKLFHSILCYLKDHTFDSDGGEGPESALKTSLNQMMDSLQSDEIARRAMKELDSLQKTVDQLTAEVDSLKEERKVTKGEVIMQLEEARESLRDKDETLKELNERIELLDCQRRFAKKKYEKAIVYNKEEVKTRSVSVFEKLKSESRYSQPLARTQSLTRSQFGSISKSKRFTSLSSVLKDASETATKTFKDSSPNSKLSSDPHRPSVFAPDNNSEIGSESDDEVTILKETTVNSVSTAIAPSIPPAPPLPPVFELNDLANSTEKILPSIGVKQPSDASAPFPSISIRGTNNKVPPISAKTHKILPGAQPILSVPPPPPPPPPPLFLLPDLAIPVKNQVPKAPPLPSNLVPAGKDPRPSLALSHSREAEDDKSLPVRDESIPPPPPPPPLPPSNLFKTSPKRDIKLMKSYQVQASSKRVKLRQIHWDNIDDIRETFWSEEEERKEKSKELQELGVFEEIEELFRIKQPVLKKPKVAETSQNLKKVSFLSRDLAQQFGINLHMFSNYTVDELVLKVLHCENEVVKNQSVLEFFNKEDLTNISQSVKKNFEPYSTNILTGEGPTKDVSELERADRIFLELCYNLRSYWRARMRCLLILLTYEKDYYDILYKLQKIDDATRAIRNSKRLKELLFIIVEIGNYMNNRQARGIKLSSLGKLAFVKASTNNNMSFLHYIERILRTKYMDLYRVIDDLSKISHLGKLTMDQVELDCREFNERIDNMERSFKTGDLSKTQNFHPEDLIVSKTKHKIPIAKRKRSLLMDQCKLTMHDLEKLMTYCGEEPKDHNAKNTFFQNFIDFVSLFKKAARENIEKEEIERIYEQRKKLLEIKERSYGNMESQNSDESAENNDTVDVLIHKLRGVTFEKTKVNKDRGKSRNNDYSDGLLSRTKTMLNDIQNI